jgi:Tol biopolymer transport system component
LRQLRWVDASGTTTGTVGEPMIATDIRIAGDGRRVAVARADPQLRTLDIWTYEEQRPVPRRLSGNIDLDASPAWSGDGSRIAWVSAQRAITIRRASADSPELTLRKFDHTVRVTDWSPDNRWIVVSAARPDHGTDILLVTADKAADVRPYAETPFNERFGTISPDGRWLAYASDESGQDEIYLDAFPAPGRRARVSVGGGTEPRWSADGTLFFRRGSEVHQVTLAFPNASPQAVATRLVFDAGVDIRSFDVAPDRTRWLINVPVTAKHSAPLTAIVNVRTLLPSAP